MPACGERPRLPYWEMALESGVHARPEWSEARIERNTSMERVRHYILYSYELVRT